VQLSLVHAEIVVIMLAQQQVAKFGFCTEKLQDYELVYTTAPDAMCLGTISWSGINQPCLPCPN